jgi:hypothetical protein
VTAGTALLGAAAACAAARFLVGTPIPLATLVRGVTLGGSAGWAMSIWHLPGPAVLPVLALVVVMLVAATCLTGELRASERAWLWRWTRERLRPAAAGHVP